jgi:hypothetical protein
MASRLALNSASGFHSGMTSLGLVVVRGGVFLPLFETPSLRLANEISSWIRVKRRHAFLGKTLERVDRKRSVQRPHESELL